MNLQIKNESHNYIFFMDIENDKNNLVQFSGILFQKKEESLYELLGSINLYINNFTNLSKTFIKLTGITQDFINKNGVSLNIAAAKIFDFLPKDDIIFIGHGIKNDNKILLSNNIELLGDFYCTWENTKNNKTHNNIRDLALQEGWFLGSPHDAFYDSWALVPIYCKIKEEERNINER